MTPTPTRTSRAPGRGATVLLLLAVVGLLFLTALPTWATAALETMSGEVPLAATGMSGAPAVWAGALVAGAAGLLTAMSGRVGTTIAGVAVLGAGIVVVIGAQAAARAPEDLLRAEAMVVTGIDAPRLTDVAATPWPWAALAVAVVLAALGVVVLVSAGRWSAAGRRYERGATPRGDAATPGADTGAPVSASQEADADRDRWVDDWDAIGRGEDPSAQDR